MHSVTLAASQVMDYLPLHAFQKCVRRYRGCNKAQHFSFPDQYLSMAFAQLIYRWWGDCDTTEGAEK